jgi:hypothetical protein
MWPEAASVGGLDYRCTRRARGWSRLANATNELVPACWSSAHGDERDHKDTTRAQNRAAGTRRAVPMRVYEVDGVSDAPGRRKLMAEIVERFQY